MMKKIIISSLIGLLLGINCICFAEEKIIKVDLNYDNSFYATIKKNYKEFWIGYYKGNIEFESYGHYYVINKINYYYYKKDNKLVLIGFVSKDGVFDKNGTLIKKCPYEDSKNNLGLASSMLDNPFNPEIVVQQNKEIGMLDSYTNIRINYINNTLTTEDITY